MSSARLDHLLRHGAALTIGTIIQAVVGMTTQIILMRQLIPQDFGQFAVVLAGCSLVQTILSLRLNVMIIRLPAEDRDSERARLYQAALVWETAAACVVALAWLAVSDLLALPALLILLSLTLGQWINQAVAFYERGMDYRRITMVETASQMVGHGAALGLIAIGLGPLSLYLREVAAILTKLVTFSVIGALPPLVLVRPRLPQIRILWREARGIWLEGILEGLFARLIILVSGAVGGLHSAGLFAQSYRLALLPHQFLAPVVSRLSANLFNRTDLPASRFRLLAQLGLGTTALVLPGIIVTWLWAVDIIPWLLGDKWNEAGHLVKAMIGVMLFFPLFDLFRAFCYAHFWTRPVLAGRLGQIVVFAVPAALLSPNVFDLSWILSAACLAGWAAMSGLTYVLVKEKGGSRT